MSPACPNVPPVLPASFAGLRLYQRFGPGLWSLVVHLAVAVLLALWTLSPGSDRGDRLQLTTSDEIPLTEPVELVAIEFEPQLASQVSASAADIAPAVVKVASAPAELTVEAVEVELAVENLLPSFDGEVGELGEVGRGGGRTRVFGLAGEGSKFVYVLDRSSSMTTTFRLCEKDRPVRDLAPLGLAKNELVRSLRELNPQQQFQIVFYNMRSVVFGDNPYVQELLPANDELKAEAEGFVADLPGLGGTNHLGALQTALKLQPEVIFLITDGERKDDLLATHVRSLIKVCQREHVTIHLIHFGAKPRPNSTLVKLATETGGQHRFINFRELAKVEDEGAGRR